MEVYGHHLKEHAQRNCLRNCTGWSKTLQKKLVFVVVGRILNVTDVVVVYGQVTGNQDGLPLVRMWKQTGDEVCMANFSLLDPYISALTCVCVCVCVCRWFCWTDYWLNKGFAPGLRDSDVTAFRLSSPELTLSHSIDFHFFCMLDFLKHSL